MLAVLEQVAARYDEPHRTYHDRRHLDRVLADVDRLLEVVAVPDPEAVRLAALFHDAVYDPRSATNEADSAALAAAVLAGAEPPERIAAVQRLVLATAGHRATAADEAVLLDADLAVLAGEPADYQRYVEGVRAEHAHVPEDGWRRGRAAVVASLLALPALFTTAPMRSMEGRARANLAAELAVLTT